MGVRDGGSSEEKREGCGVRREKRLGELTLRGDIESFAILQKKNNARKVLFWWRANVICLGESGGTGWDEAGTAFQKGGFLMFFL